VQPLPALAPTCSFSPASISGSGQATLTVTTTGASARAWHPAEGAVPAYALWLLVIGMVAGIGFRSHRKGKEIFSVAVACLFASLLFGVAPTDPATFVVVTLGLGLVTALASFLPARRAAGMDPMQTLRSE